MGAGIYTTVLKVEVCADSQCSTQVGGSPTNVTVTYTITGNPLPATQLSWTQMPIAGAQLVTSETHAPTLQLRIVVTDLPPDGIYLFRSTPSTGLITGMVFGPPTFTSIVGSAYGEYTVTLKIPAALGSGVFTDTVNLRGCFDQACVREIPNSRFTMNVRAVVTATAGLEYSRRMFIPAHGATNVVWSAARQSLYVVSSENASNGPIVGVDPMVIQVDPQTGAAGPAVALVGENLLHAAVSDDGSLLYVASKNKPFVHRITLPSMLPDLVIPLGSFNQNEPYLVSDMAVLPGQPQSLLAAVAHNNSHGGTRVYDDAVLRADVIAPAQDFELARWLVPGATAGVYLSQSVGPSNPKFNNMQQLAVDGNGVHVNSSTASVSDIIIGGDRPQRAGNRLFLRDGRILDATTGAQLGALALPDSAQPTAVLVDEANNRVLVWQGYLISYDLTTLQMLALVAPGGVSTNTSPVNGKMVLWGTNGVALADGANLIILSGSFFTTYRGSPTM